MNRKICYAIAFATFVLAFAVSTQVKAQRLRGGGGIRPGVGAGNFGGGSITHRNFSPPANFSRPEISRPSMPREFQRPNLPTMPSHPNLPERIGGGRSLIHPIGGEGGIRSTPGPRDTVRPGATGGERNLIPGPGGGERNVLPTAHDGGPDWKNWKDFTPKSINNSVINKVNPSPKTINDIRNHFSQNTTGKDIWSKDWFDKHPDAWNPSNPRPHPDPHPGPPLPPPPHFWWNHPGWDNAWGWFGAGFFGGVVADAIIDPIPYDYGNNVIYDGDTVYVNNVPYVGADEYYQQAQDLANAGAEDTTTEQELATTNDAQKTEQPKVEEQWIAMGTFAVTADGKQTQSDHILQIAANKKGQVRGNLVDTKTDKAVELYGSIDPKTQRVAFKLDGNDDVVAECGLWNLTQDTLTMLVHVNRDKTEERTLTRLSDNTADKSATPAAPAEASPI